MTDMPTMRAAFRTTVSGDGKYEMVFRFPSMEAMHAADDEWRAALATPASDVAPVAISQSTQRMAEILGTEWRARPPLAQSVDPVAGHANTERDAIELFAHLNCPSCGGSGHIDDVTVDPVAGEALREVAAKYADMGIDERAEAMADNCDGDPWELIGYFREKLRQSQARVDAANNAATGFAKKLAALKGPAA